MKAGKKTIVYLDRSEDVTFRKYSDGTARFTFQGDTLDALEHIAKKQRTSLKKALLRAFAELWFRRAVAISAGKAVAV